MSFRPSSVVLLVANAVPLAGVLLFGWDVLGLLLLYWAECVAIGLLNVLRMSTCETRGAVGEMLPAPPLNQTASLRYHHLPSLPAAAVKLCLIPFFIVHYGLFCVGYLAAVVGLFSPDGLDVPLAQALPALWDSSYWLPLAAIVASHLYSYGANFMGAGEFRKTHIMALMQRPYARIVPMHLAIMMGAGGLIWLGSPLPMLVVLAIAKTVIDLRMHARERQLLSARTPGDFAPVPSPTTSRRPARHEARRGLTVRRHS